MRLSAILAVLTSAVTLSACVSLTPEQISKLNSEHATLSNALIPACIESGLGQKPNYSTLQNLGYKQRDTVFGEGDYFYSPDKSIFGANKNVRFNSGKGCTLTIISEGSQSLDPIGQAWHSQLAAKGYKDTGNDGSRYEFTANGIPFAFVGQFRASNNAQITTLTIERDR